jgi:hypothetical protein
MSFSPAEAYEKNAAAKFYFLERMMMRSKGR